MTPQAQAIWSGLEFRKPMMLRNVEPLSEEHLDWIPGEGRKSIRWQLWHIVEVEDNWIRSCQLDEPERLPFGEALSDAVSVHPTKSQLLDYLAEVRELSRTRLEQMDDAAFDRLVRDPDFGEMTARDLWLGVVTGFAWHAGQIALTAKLIPGTPVTTWNFTPWDSGGRGSGP